MAKKKVTPEESPAEPVAETPAPEMVAERTPWRTKVVAASATAVLLVAMIVGGFNLYYAGKIFPGAAGDGAYLGGLTRDQATDTINHQADLYASQLIPVTYDQTTLRISPGRLGVDYHAAQTAAEAYSYGRRGSVWQRLREQVSAMTGSGPSLAHIDYDPAKLYPYVTQVLEDVTKPVSNAALGFQETHSYVVPAVSGRRLDVGTLVLRINHTIEQGSTAAVAAPVYDLGPVIDTASVQAVAAKADTYLSGPIKVQLATSSVTIAQSDIVKWIEVQRATPHSFQETNNVADLEQPPASVNVALNQASLQAYVANLADDLDRTPQDALLDMVDGQLAITKDSQDGYKIDQAQAYAAIQTAVNTDSDNRVAKVNAVVTKAKVTRDTINDLGIKELISTGQTYFPGSPSTRLTNVRAGANKFNNVLLAPDEVFSFGKILGDVGPETGYVPELVILGDHEEKQYGGGLCQVSSTAFRAALAAGLPILERVNHAFAISYYTAPYGVPGVDATIYYPSVDFKFKNDTGHYILMQTLMQGTSLKFSFYGTKVKSGVIRGPEFVTGSTDATQPSHTVFYRDVLDLAGNVMKTDTFNTYYKSSKDFPITKQFN